MSKDRPDDDPARIANGFSKVLSSHGHGFQYAVLRRAEELADAGGFGWHFQAAEFAVAVGSYTTHIDLILRANAGPMFLVGECKRADPARARWCFAKAPYTWREAHGGEAIFEIFVDGRAREKVVSVRPGPYHVAFTLRKSADPDDQASAPRESAKIDDAVTQVLRGVNGLAYHILREPTIRDPQAPRAARFLPAVFTTAELWVTDADLGEADLASGRVEISEVKRVSWLWYTYNQSPHIQHRMNPRQSDDVASSLPESSARTVAIVSPSGLDEFLRLVPAHHFE